MPGGDPQQSPATAADENRRIGLLHGLGSQNRVAELIELAGKGRPLPGPRVSSARGANRIHDRVDLRDDQLAFVVEVVLAQRMTLERIVHQDAAQIGMARAKADISVVDFIGMFKKNQRNQLGRRSSMRLS